MLKAHQPGESVFPGDSPKHQITGFGAIPRRTHPD